MTGPNADRIVRRLLDADVYQVERRPAYPVRPTEEDRRRINDLMAYAEEERVRLVDERNRWRVLAWVWAALFVFMLVVYTWRVYGGAK